MIIDIHTHISKNKLFNRYRETANAEDLEEEMKEAGIDYAVVLAAYFPHSSYENSGINNIELLEKIEKYNGNLIPFGSIDVDNNLKNGINELEGLIANNKIWGVKLYPGYQYFYPDEKRIYPLYEICQAYNVPVMYHSGALSNKSGKLKYSTPIHIDEVAVDFPKLNIIISHLGIPFIYETAEIIRKNPNVYTDISGLTATRKDRSFDENFKGMNNILMSILQYDEFQKVYDKILFGSDFPITSIKDATKIVENLGLHEDNKRKIYFENATKLLKNYFDKKALIVGVEDE